MATYQIVSIKHSEDYTGTLRGAIERTLAIDADYQPTAGVTLATAGDSTLLETDHIDLDISILSEEAAEAGDTDQVTLCERALAGDEDARLACLIVIATAAAQGVR